jgi:hypothetical protein
LFRLPAREPMSLVMTPVAGSTRGMRLCRRPDVRIAAVGAPEAMCTRADTRAAGMVRLQVRTPAASGSATPHRPNHPSSTNVKRG